MGTVLQVPSTHCTCPTGQKGMMTMVRFTVAL